MCIQGVADVTFGLFVYQSPAPPIARVDGYAGHEIKKEITDGLTVSSGVVSER
jgi:hypothetical protein